MTKRDATFERIEEYRHHFSQMPSDEIHARLKFGALVKEAQIALRQVLEQRSSHVDQHVALRPEATAGANCSIELHDSVIADAGLHGTSVELAFSPAVLHRSDGEPGVDAGTVWLQDALLTIDDPSELIPPMTAFWEISGGSLSAGSTQWVNVIPIPVRKDGPIVLTLELVDGRTIRIGGRAISIDVSGPAHFLEAFPGGK